MNLPYAEGTVFGVPLRDGKWARGVVARATAKGPIILGYFFGPRVSSPSEVRLNDLFPASAILCVRCSDLGLIEGKWRIAGAVPHWDRRSWLIPRFMRRDPLTGKRWLVRYSDVDPNKVESEQLVECSEDLPAERLYGDGAVEIALTKRLSSA